MNYAVIDIGTNTIRSVIYNENLLPVAQIVAESVILQHTENHMLTTTGIDRLHFSSKTTPIKYSVLQPLQ